MSDIAIRVEQLGKRYRLGERQASYKTLRSSLSSLASSIFRNPLSSDRSAETTLWALRDVSFDVRQGEVLGVIGRNGSGKSTLLKILSRITQPTEGSAEIRGRVGSLLEVGSGFHPELTGRENIYLNGAILGMRRAELDRKFDAIVEFAEIEQFLDTPVKHYSSGMYMRLAFAVAAHLEPEILIVDEVLAVGDADFQKKCLGKMRDVAGEGRTVLFVSHNLGAVQALTTTCLHLAAGKNVAFGPANAIIQNYLLTTTGHTSGVIADVAMHRRNAFTDSPVRIASVSVNNHPAGQAEIELGADFNISIFLDAQQDVQDACLAIELTDVSDQQVVMFFSWDYDFRLSLDPGQHVVEIAVKNLPLAPGNYFCRISINQTAYTIAYDVIARLPLLQVVNNGQIVHYLHRNWGMIHHRQVTWKALSSPLAHGSTTSSNASGSYPQ